MDFKIAVIPGDGIGPEVTREAQNVLDETGAKFGHKFNYTELIAGGAAIDKYGEPLPPGVIEACRECDAVLLGAVGGWKWDNLPGHLRPERALLELRGGLGLFANLRPATVYEALKHACPLKPDILKSGIDIMIVRELTGGSYFGDRGRKGTGDEHCAWDTEMYSTAEVKRVAKAAFEIALKRRRHVTSVDKANVMESSRLWREVVIDVAKEYPDVTLAHMYVDNAAMQLIRDPGQFDVIVSSNMFGDILSDEASQLTGSIGMLPSASLGVATPGMFEPIHGSAPDIAGQDKANPIATILSVAMMLRYSFGLNVEADAIERAVTNTLQKGYRTGDIYSEGHTLVGTSQIGQIIRSEIHGH
jgi:3-isopropylmalate dehydrogenase